MTEQAAKVRIVLIDDSLNDLSSKRLVSLREQIPNIEFQCFQFMHDYFESVEASLQKGEVVVPPTATMIDCYSGLGPEAGYYDAIEMLGTLPANLIPSHILFLSGDEDFSNKTAPQFEEHLAAKVAEGESHLASIKAYAVSRREVNLVANLLYKRALSFSMTERVTTGFRRFLNSVIGTHFPVNSDEITAIILKQENMPPSEIAKMHATRNLSDDQMLILQRENVERAWNHGFKSTVKVPDDFDFGTYVRFLRFSGDLTKGVACFSVSEVERACAEGQDSVFVTKEFHPFTIAKVLGKVKGVVLLSPESPAHMASLFGVHHITGLYGAPEGTVIDEDDGRLIGVTFPNGQVLKSGDIVTFDTDLNSLAIADLDIKEPKNDDEYYRKWLWPIERASQEKLKERGFRFPDIKKTIGSPSEIGNFIDSGFGLVRSEYLMAEESDATEAFRLMLLKRDGKARRQFMRTQEDMFRRYFQATSIHQTNRMRLMDALPEDVFDRDEQRAMTQHFGHPQLRGVQLARRLPSLYRNQIKSLCKVFKEAVDDNWSSQQPEPLEIMVPTVRTLDDVMFVKKMVGQLTAEFGLAAGQVKFGVMMETLDAGRNIESIAPECDFISIGSNDYTAEFFGCDRSDWEGRLALREKLAGVDPFVTLDRQVVIALADIMNRARLAKPNLEIDLCGDHAADAASVAAMIPCGLNAISVKPSPRNMTVLAAMSAYLALDAFPTPS